MDVWGAHGIQFLVWLFLCPEWGGAVPRGAGPWLRLFLIMGKVSRHPGSLGPQWGGRLPACSRGCNFWQAPSCLWSSVFHLYVAAGGGGWGVVRLEQRCWKPHCASEAPRQPVTDPRPTPGSPDLVSPGGGLGVRILASFLADLMLIQKHILDCSKDQNIHDTV